MTPQQIKNAAPWVEKREKIQSLLEGACNFELDGDDPFVRWMSWDKRRELETKVADALLENLKAELNAIEAELRKLGVKL